MSVEIKSQATVIKRSRNNTNQSKKGGIITKNVEFPTYNDIVDEAYLGMKPKGYR